MGREGEWGGHDTVLRCAAGLLTGKLTVRSAYWGHGRECAQAGVFLPRIALTSRFGQSRRLYLTVWLGSARVVRQRRAPGSPPSAAATRTRRDRATNAGKGPVNLRRATLKPLISLSGTITVNQPSYDFEGSSPSSPTILIPQRFPPLRDPLCYQSRY
jgi:hypothetical protein